MRLILRPYQWQSKLHRRTLLHRGSRGECSKGISTTKFTKASLQILSLPKNMLHRHGQPPRGLGTDAFNLVGATTSWPFNCHQEQQALLPEFVCDSHQHLQIFHTFIVNSFSFWPDLWESGKGFGLIALRRDPSEEAWCLFMDLHKHILDLAFFASAKCNTIAKRYTFMKSFTSHLPSLCLRLRFTELGRFGRIDRKFVGFYDSEDQSSHFHSWPTGGGALSCPMGLQCSISLQLPCTYGGEASRHIFGLLLATTVLSCTTACLQTFLYFKLIIMEKSWCRG